MLGMWVWRNACSSVVMVRSSSAGVETHWNMWQWLNSCPAAKTVLMTQGSIIGSRLKADSAFYPSKISIMNTQLPMGVAMCSLHICKLPRESFKCYGAVYCISNTLHIVLWNSVLLPAEQGYLQIGRGCDAPPASRLNAQRSEFPIC